MLQQTAVETVKPYFRRWAERFPDLDSLADASEREVLSLWEGLGYYGRARRLLKAARRMTSEHDGRLPATRSELLDLPGIGAYIADAVLSLAYGRDVVALDTNVVRTMMRLAALEGTGREADVRRRTRRMARAGLPAGEARDYNQALMDFGAVVCRPRRPRCGECVVPEFCKARKEGLRYDIPRPRSRNLRDVRTAVAVFLSNGRAYIQKRPPEGLFASMWEFPGGKLETGEKPREAVVRECREELGVACRPLEKLIELTHYYTVFRVRLHAFICTAEGLPEDRTHRWVDVEELDEYPLPSASRQVVDALRQRRQ